MRGLNKIKALHVANGQNITTTVTQVFSEESPLKQESDRELEIDKFIL